MPIVAAALRPPCAERRLAALPRGAHAGRVRGLGLGLLVMTVTGSALATEPNAPVSPYTTIALTSGPTRPAAFEGSLAARQLRLGLESEPEPSIAGFSREAETGDRELPPPEGLPRLQTIRKELDDDRQAECVGLPQRPVRSALEDSLDSAPPSPTRQLRTSLD